MSAPAVGRYVASLGSAGRQVADGEWGVTVDAEDWPLHIGLRCAHGVLVAQAMVLGADALEDRTLLRANRALDQVHFALTESGEVWVRGSVPLAGATEAEVDRLLALLVRAAEWARVHAGRRRASA